MIAFLRGTVADALPQCLVVDVNGVGYEVTVPLSTFDQLNPVIGQGIMLKIHMHVRENAQVLYGFATDAERDIFRLLIDRVSGIGPATAIAILSGLNVNTFKQAVVQGDVQAIARAKGVGKRTAERIILELKDKLAKEQDSIGLQSVAATGRAMGGKVTEAAAALQVLGCTQADISTARKGIDVDALPLEEIIRQALKKMVK
jgi:Holliday junction DNA helicase RuvA